MGQTAGSNFLRDAIDEMFDAIDGAVAHAMRERGLRQLEKRASDYVTAFLSEQGDAISEHALKEFDRHDFQAGGPFTYEFGGSAHGGIELGEFGAEVSDTLLGEVEVYEVLWAIARACYSSLAHLACEKIEKSVRDRGEEGLYTFDVGNEGDYSAFLLVERAEAAGNA